MTDRQDLLAVLRPLTRALRRIEDVAAGERGLTMWQYAVLAVVERQPGLNQGEVAARLDYSKNRIVADLDHLERAGFIIRRSGVDRRSNVLTITSSGRDARAAVQRRIHRGEDELLAGLSSSTRRALRQLARG